MLVALAESPFNRKFAISSGRLLTKFGEVNEAETSRTIQVLENPYLVIVPLKVLKDGDFDDRLLMSGKTCSVNLAVSLMMIDSPASSHEHVSMAALSTRLRQGGWLRLGQIEKPENAAAFAHRLRVVMQRRLVAEGVAAEDEDPAEGAADDDGDVMVLWLERWPRAVQSGQVYGRAWSRSDSE